MSAPLKLTPWQVKALAEFMTELSALTARTKVEAGAYGPLEIQVGESVLRLSWVEESRQYEINDRNGD